jgi:hypothetical protein
MYSELRAVGLHHVMVVATESKCRRIMTILPDMGCGWSSQVFRWVPSLPPRAGRAAGTWPGGPRSGLTGAGVRFVKWYSGWV